MPQRSLRLRGRNAPRPQSPVNTARVSLTGPRCSPHVGAAPRPAPPRQESARYCSIRRIMDSATPTDDSQLMPVTSRPSTST
ncbi:hypothetical protein YQ44_27090 [Janthinobacterium sp. 1_2014MBL_MicDiv]|nr:hypothetical protein YQ44_27090 [Janthinobacterium sp. 1_2014MBL_MicDiv]